MAIRSLRGVWIMMAMLSLTMLVGLASPAGAQDTDPKDDCKKGGWETLTTAEGEAFDNQGNCVSYVAADGGVPVSRPVFTVEFQSYTEQEGCSWRLLGSGFTPHAMYFVEYYFDDSLWATVARSGSFDGYLHFVILDADDAGHKSVQLKAYAADENGDQAVDPIAVSNVVFCPPA